MARPKDGPTAPALDYDGIIERLHERPGVWAIVYREKEGDDPQVIYNREYRLGQIGMDEIETSIIRIKGEKVLQARALDLL